MMRPLATYSFLPWLRQGLANKITDQDERPERADARVGARRSSRLTGEPVTGTTALTADVDRDVRPVRAGRHRRHRPARDRPHRAARLDHQLRAELPAAVEFYDEDFPWRYTPAAPDGARLRLRPWIALVVLEEDEFEDGRNVPAGRCRASTCSTPARAARRRRAVGVGARARQPRRSPAATTSSSAPTWPRSSRGSRTRCGENADLAYSRIVCPRRLKPNTAYHAFLVPAFETGRLAGLGLDPTPARRRHVLGLGRLRRQARGGEPARTTTAGTSAPAPRATSSTLVRLLEPQPVDTRVGVRDIDVREPGAELPGHRRPDLGGILKLGGALRVPRVALHAGGAGGGRALRELGRSRTRTRSSARWPRSSTCADDYAEHAAADANAAAGLRRTLEDDPDPLITPPLYGRWHALTQRLLTRRATATPVDPDDNWVHELNLDPRYRVAAGFGTRVVQDQPGDVHGRRVGAGRRRARGQPADPAGPARAS